MTNPDAKAELFAVQAHMKMADYTDEASFRKKIGSLFDRIDEKRLKNGEGKPALPGLAVFPEMIGAFLGMAGYYDLVKNQKTGEAAMTRVAMTMLPKLAWTLASYRTLSLKRGLFVSQSEKIHKIWRGVFSHFARERGLWVVAGSTLLPMNKFDPDSGVFRALDSKIYNLSYAFDPDGKCVDVTRKVNLVPTQEDLLELSPGPDSDLKPFDTPFGKVGSLICYDGFQEAHTSGEPCFSVCARRHAKMGASILAQPSANPWPWEEAWLFNEPNENQLRKGQWLKEGLFGQLSSLEGVRYAVNPMLNAAFLDYHFDGPSFIFERTPEGEAKIIAQAARADISPESEEIVCARIPADA